MLEGDNASFFTPEGVCDQVFGIAAITINMWFRCLDVIMRIPKFLRGEGSVIAHGGWDREPAPGECPTAEASNMLIR